MKKLTLVIVAVIVVAYAAGLFVTRNLHTEISIDAPRDAVWMHLSEFGRHAEWNPFIRRITGEAIQGARIAVTIQPPGGDAMGFEPEVLVVDENRELRWLGQLLIPGLFDGEHYFLLEDNSNDGTQFVQGEHFRGILALLLWDSIAQDTRRGFEAMNEALKARSEAGQ